MTAEQPLNDNSQSLITEELAMNKQVKGAKQSRKSKDSELHKLQDTLAHKEDELTVTKEALLRLRADFDNFRKRTVSERQAILRRAQEEVIATILPVMDSFDRSLESFQDDHSAEQVFAGFMLIQKQLEDTLRQLGVTKLNCAGQAFDATRHDALFHQESDQPENTVLNVCQAGYLYHDKVMRPAQVILAGTKNNKEEE